MERRFTRTNAKRLEEKLRLIRIKSTLAIVLGDSRDVAVLTCEAARIKDAISFAARMAVEPLKINCLRAGEES